MLLGPLQICKDTIYSMETYIPKTDEIHPSKEWELPTTSHPEVYSWMHLKSIVPE